MPNYEPFGLMPNYEPFGLMPNYEPFGLMPNYEPFGLMPNYEPFGLKVSEPVGQPVSRQQGREFLRKMRLVWHRLQH
jgi:hypothetical protein